MSNSRQMQKTKEGEILDGGSSIVIQNCPLNHINHGDEWTDTPIKLCEHMEMI
uniref:Uncharacterized protein n=1 Tax=Arion vulgaris TaxID=1028688 RepID=A0A0B7AVI7_9EUPU